MPDSKPFGFHPILNTCFQEFLKAEVQDAEPVYKLALQDVLHTLQGHVEIRDSNWTRNAALLTSYAAKEVREILVGEYVNEDTLSVCALYYARLCRAEYAMPRSSCTVDDMLMTDSEVSEYLSAYHALEALQADYLKTQD